MSTIAAIHVHHDGRPIPGLDGERERALDDLLREGHFQPISDRNGPYRIDLSVHDNRLVFLIKNANDEDVPGYALSLKPYRRIIKDYFLIIQSYEKMRAEGSHTKLEAIDMGRRGLHNEAAEMMRDRLKDKIETDLPTARRMFTLLCGMLGDQGRGVY